MSEIAVLIPIYKKKLDYYESVSLHRTLTFFHNKADVIFFGPPSIWTEGIECDFNIDLLEANGFTSFRSKFFENRKTYNSLLLNLDFYDKFKKYKYLLIAQTDVFIFGGDLKKWGREDFDYVGAPWWRDSVNPSSGLCCVGNGGLSLRKVESAVKVLESFYNLDLPYQLFDTCIDSTDMFKNITRLLFLIQYNQRVGCEHRGHIVNEDRYWGRVASSVFPWYKVPDPYYALKFSFEVHPEKMYTINNNNLPFGCHAWSRYGFDFWRPKIRRYGYDV